MAHVGGNSAELTIYSRSTMQPLPRDPPEDEGSAKRQRVEDGATEPTVIELVVQREAVRQPRQQTVPSDSGSTGESKEGLGGGR